MTTHARDAEPATDAPPHKPGWSSHASEADAAEFAGHLAALARTGLPLPSGLRALAAELPTRRLRRPLGLLADRLERGDALDAAMVGVAERFPAPLRGLMVAGARSGKLADVLAQYVRYAGLGADLRRRFWMAIAYPVFLLAVLLALFLFVCIWIVPAFEFVLKDFGVEVPAATQLLFLLGGAVRSRGPSIAGLAALLGLVAFVAFRFTMDPAQRRVLLSSIPLLGPLLRWSSLSEYCHLAGLLVEAEMPLPEALALAGGGVGDAELARASSNLRSAVEAGSSLADALITWPRCPAGLTDVLADSEGRGDLAPALHLAGDMFEARARVQGSFAATLFAAMTLLAVVWGGGFVLTALYLPMIRLIQRFF